jgi:Mrp family chromosome partitioning ATPase
MSPQRRSSTRRLGIVSQHPAAWIGARARNALRRPAFISLVSGLTFVASLMALVIVPQQARKSAAALRPPASLRPDTEPTVAALGEAQRQVAAADSNVAQARRDIAQLITATAVVAATDTGAGGVMLSAAVRARRDSLNEQVNALGRLISRSENAPLLGSYRALAQAPAMQGDVRVKAMLDSLVEIERERDSYSAVGGVDPVFVTLTARANELGRNIETLADARRTALKTELTTIAPAAPVMPAAIAARPIPDTLEKMRERDAAQVAAAGVANRLARERAELLALDAREEKAQELANVGASPSAMLAAALVFGAVLGFGLALFNEVRHPRIADGYEVERATGVRVLGEIRRLPPSDERGRRGVDRSAPGFIDPGADGHQLVYLTIATAGVNAVMLTVTGDVPAVTAVVAINFAAIAADEARETLLLDADGTAATVSAALRIRPSAGIAGVAKGSVDWPQAIRTTSLGRSRSIDVVPTGDGVTPVEQLAQVLQRDSSSLSRRYDAIVMVAALEQVTAGLAAAMAIPDVLLCVRAGQTPIEDLKASLEAIEKSGAHTRGIVMWNAPLPVLAELRPTEDAELEAEAVA